MKRLLSAVMAAAFLALAPLGASAYASEPAIVTGAASYYADKFHGRRTASGENYDKHQLTAAHRTLPFGTRVRVTNKGNGKSVIVRINDRGPFAGKRVIDLSRAAAQSLGMIRSGVAKVQVEILG